MSDASMAGDAGITRSGESLGGVVWDILGQTYRPVQHATGSLAFDAVFPPGTRVPPHIHHHEDKYIAMVSGTFSLWFDGEALTAGPGDLIRMPMGFPHGIANSGDEAVHALFWFAPAQKMYDMFVRLDGVKDPAVVVQIAAEYGVEFLPPPD